MKKHIAFFAIMVFIAGFMITSCNKSSKNDLKETAKNLEEKEKEIKDLVTINWENFKKESDSIFEKTQKDMEELRKQISKSTKKEQENLNKELDKLEVKNKELKLKIEERSRLFKENLIEFNEMAEEKEQSFEREFKHDINELNNAINDFFKDNVD